MLDSTPRASRARIRQWVLLAHAAITTAAGCVLVVRPALIPASVGIHLAPDTYLLSYLLAAAEFGFATLSGFGASLTDLRSLRVVLLATIVLHAASAILETYVWRAHMVPVLAVNVVARVLIVGVLTWLLPRASE